MHVGLSRRRGGRRRLALLAPIAALIAISGFAVANAGASGPSGPRVVPPNEPVNQLTVNVAADGSLSLPFRATQPCGGFCPGNGNLAYTTIAPGKTNIIVNDPSGTNAKISFGKLLARSVGPRNKQAHATPRLKAGQLTVSVTIGKAKSASFVLIVEPDPYNTTTTSSSTPDSSPPLQHVVVTLTGGGGGDSGTMTVSPNPSHAGPTDVVLVDNRDNKIGTPQLFLDVQPGLGNIALGRPGQHVTTVMCPHDWIAYVSFPGGDGPTTTTMFLGHGYGVNTIWSVDGSDPVDCTTPIT